MTFIEWSQQLLELLSKHHDVPVCQIRLKTAEAQRLFDDGMTPEQAFRETYEMED